MSDRTDWDLVALAQQGDRDAFAELVQRYQQPVVHFCYRMAGTQPDAEELAQDSFIRVYKHLHRLTPQAKFSTFLFGIARNLTLNFLRDSRRRGRGVTDSMTREDSEERAIEDEDHRPDRRARLAEIESLIERGMARLSPDHREILLLREVQGMEYESIAEVLGCRKGTVKSRLARAREQLRVQLIELGGESL
jgi:RNA polymerase sigma-70 factor, ECF subfamily